MKYQMMLIKQKQNLLDLQNKAGVNGSKSNVTAEVKETNVKETMFENPTEDDIKQLIEPQQDLKQKKNC